MTETTQLKLALLCVILAMTIWALPALHLLMGIAVGYVLMSVALCGWSAAVPSTTAMTLGATRGRAR